MASYRFSPPVSSASNLPPPLAGLMSSSESGSIRSLSSSTMTPSSVLNQMMSQQQPMSQRQQTAGVGAPMQGATALLTQAGLTPLKVVTQTNPNTGEEAKYVKVADDMGNKCYVDITGSGGVTSVAESMRRPMVQVEQKSVTQPKYLADLAEMGVLASGVIYECQEGMCSVTRVKDNVPMETRYVHEGNFPQRTGMGTYPIMPMSDVLGAKAGVASTLAMANSKLRESTRTATSERLKMETKILADNTNSLNDFVKVREQAIAALRQAEQKIRDLLVQFAQLPASELTGVNQTKIQALKQELSKRVELSEGLESISQDLQNMSPLDSGLAQKAVSAVQTVKNNLVALSQPIMPISSTLGAQSATSFNSAISSPAAIGGMF